MSPCGRESHCNSADIGWPLMKSGCIRRHTMEPHLLSVQGSMRHSARPLPTFFTGKSSLGDFQKDWKQERMAAFFHEGIHSPRVHKDLGARGTWEKNHRGPFNDSACRMLKCK